MPLVRQERAAHTICARVRRSGGRRREVSWCRPPYRTSPCPTSLRRTYSTASHPCNNGNMTTLSTIMFWLSIYIHSRKPIPRHNNIIRLSTTSRTRSPSLQTDTVYQHARYWADDTWKIDAIPSRNRQPLAVERWRTANQRSAYNRTCNPSCAVFCERLEIDSKVLSGACMLWSNALTVRLYAVGTPVSWAVGCETGTGLWTLAPPAAGSAKARAPEGCTGCGTFAPRSNSDVESRRAHTHGPLLNASSVGDVHRGSRVLAARVSASDWTQRGGRHRAAPPLTAHFLDEWQ